MPTKINEFAMAAWESRIPKARSKGTFQSPAKPRTAPRAKA